MSQKNGYLWWEKTVEYAFVRNVIPEVSNAFPLDGNVEKALGDLLLQDGSMMRLIEFKSEESDIQSEKRKWGLTAADNHDYKNKSFHQLLHSLYAKCTEGIPGHRAHWFIYGKHDGTKLKIETQSYWGDPSTRYPLENHEDLEKLTTATRLEMLDYLYFLELYRGVSGYSTVNFVLVGVSRGRTLFLTAEEFLTLCPEHQDTSKEAQAASIPRNTKKNVPKF